MTKLKAASSRVRALKAALLATSTHCYPYSDVDEMCVLRDAGLLDSGFRITLEGALVVLRAAANNQVDWVAVQETQRVLVEIKKLFSERVWPGGE